MILDHMDFFFGGMLRTKLINFMTHVIIGDENDREL